MEIVKKEYCLFIVIILAAFLLFWKIGSHNLNEWDEARNGVNAYEMCQNHDYINLHYDHEPDTWNAKPPLVIWMIAGCYHIFGFNEFALRLPSAISAFLFFIVFYKLVRLVKDDITAFITCLILLSCKAIIGLHVGLTGDFDMLLTLFLTLSAYYFILFINFGQAKGIYLCTVYTALAFYTKGTAGLLFIPGFIIYALLYKQGKILIKSRHVWLALLLFITIAGSWIVMIAQYGKTSAHSAYNSKNTLEVMFIHDTYRRLTSSSFDPLKQNSIEPNHLFFFEMLDMRFNLWNYLFYLSLFIGLVQLYRHRKGLRAYILADSHRAALLSVSLLLPIIIILTLAVYKHNWYFAPFFGFIAVLIAVGIVFGCRRWKPGYYLFTAVFLFTLIRHFIYINDLATDMHWAQQKNKKLFSTGIVLKDMPKQDIFLYTEWIGLPVTRVQNVADLLPYKGQTFIGDQNFVKDSLAGKSIPQSCYDDYCAVKIQ